jgi:hypothetical protein
MARGCSMNVVCGREFTSKRKPGEQGHSEAPGCRLNCELPKAFGPDPSFLGGLAHPISPGRSWKAGNPVASPRRSSSPVPPCRSLGRSSVRRSASPERRAKTMRPPRAGRIVFNTPLHHWPREIIGRLRRPQPSENGLSGRRARSASPQSPANGGGFRILSVRTKNTVKSDT